MKKGHGFTVMTIILCALLVISLAMNGVLFGRLQKIQSDYGRLKNQLAAESSAAAASDAVSSSAVSVSTASDPRSSAQTSSGSSSASGRGTQADAAAAQANTAAAQAGTATQTETAAPQQTDTKAAGLKAASSYNELIIVEATGTTCTVSFHQKGADGVWSQLLETNGYIGRNGLEKTAEGDGKTPVGVYAAGTAFGSQPDPGCPAGYLQVDSSYYWVDDPSSQYYNRLVSTNEVQQDWSSGENIVGTGSAYNYVLSIGYNTDCTPGLGSAVFLHCSTGRPTAGCVSIPENEMITILQNLTDGCAFVIDTPENISAY
ncbi:MAG: hypothetical protein ACI4D6_05550 [Chordicoccus sp.]